MQFTDLLLRHEPLFRMGVFLSILVIMWRWEIKSPKRQLSVKKSLRWTNNLGLVILNSLALRFLLPIAGVGVAILCQQNGWGFFNIAFEPPLPAAVTIIVSMVFLDFAVYLQHRVMHHVPLLWRLHRVHHLDLDIDLTTGLRFHPLEIILSMLFKFSLIALLGVPALAVILFEVILNGCAIFNHSNVALPHKLDRRLRKFIVTPDMHRVHHSTVMSETNSNYGFCLSLWDRILATYVPQPKAGHEDMTIGLAEFRDQNTTQKISPLLLSPFRRN